MKKRYLGLLFTGLLVISACNNTVNNTTVQETGNNVYQVNQSEGASLSFKINPAQGFNTKANTNGTAAKTSADISNYIVYLVKNSATGGYPAGGDPIGDAVAGPITITGNGSGSQTITFTNIPPSAPDAYYVALKAQDGSSNLIKDNNGSGTAWTGTTASDTLKIAVSTGPGIVVAADYTVSSTTALTVTPQLLDAVGATIEAGVTPTNGADKTNSDITAN